MHTYFVSPLFIYHFLWLVIINIVTVTTTPIIVYSDIVFCVCDCVLCWIPSVFARDKSLFGNGAAVLLTNKNNRREPWCARQEKMTMGLRWYVHVICKLWVPNTAVKALRLRRGIDRDQTIVCTDAVKCKSSCAYQKLSKFFFGGFVFLIYLRKC